MRVHVVDFYPHVCGATTLGWQTYLALKAAGLEAEHVTYTKSGKPHKRWLTPNTLQNGCGASFVQPTMCLSYDDAVEHMRSCDLIVLNEPRSANVDREAAKDFLDEPPYIGWLRDAGTPWVTFMPRFGRHDMEYMGKLMSRTRFEGAIVPFPSLVPRCMPDHARVILNNKMPYAPRYSLDSELPQKPGITIVGRIQPNKAGWSSVLAVLPMIQPCEIEIFGGCSKARSASTAFKILEGLKAEYGGVGRWLYPEQMRGWASRPIYADPWEWRGESGHVVRFMGGPEWPIPYRSVAVNLSSIEFTHGLIEWVGMEAMDAGAMLVTAPHLLAGDHDVYEVWQATRHRECARMTGDKDGCTGFIIDEGPGFDLAWAVNDALVAPDRERIALRNRVALREANDQVAYARRLLAVAGMHEYDGPVYTAAAVRAMGRDGEREWLGDLRMPGY